VASRDPIRTPIFWLMLGSWLYCCCCCYYYRTGVVTSHRDQRKAYLELAVFSQACWHRYGHPDGRDCRCLGMNPTCDWTGRQFSSVRAAAHRQTGGDCWPPVWLTDWDAC
jgi:hypothetical protein